MIAPLSWLFMGGVLLWRGKVKSRWNAAGLDSSVFDLFIRMKGAETRTKLLHALSTPKDRLELARELGIDWKAVDYHVVLFKRHNLIKEWKAYGKVRLYCITASGESLLALLDLNINPGVPAQNPAQG